MEKLIIATRASNLALWQAYHIKERIETSFPEITVELNEITSKGDKILDKPLALIGGKGHFTKELEDEMLEGNADLAVHSLKDVPTYIPEGLELCAITTRQDQSDVLLSHTYKSLDELPQLFNVLKGEMSLIGPRPELPMLVKHYEPWQRKRFAVPQGITGWWQINGRSDKPMHLHTEDDLYYLQHYSLLLDITILIKTIWVVLKGKGAY